MTDTFIKNCINNFINFHPICANIFYYFERYFLLWLLPIFYYFSYLLCGAYSLFLVYLIWQQYRVHKNLYNMSGKSNDGPVVNDEQINVN